MQTINNLIHGLAFMRRLLATLWLHRWGRWYVFRDQPTWFVNEVAAVASQFEGDDFLEQFVLEARKERDGRILRELNALKATMEAAINKEPAA